MRDLASNIGPVQAVAPQVLSATNTSAAIDLLGFNSAAVVINTGAIVSSGDFTAKLQESDTTTSGDFANDVTLDFSRPGKPTDNGFIEAFNSKLRAECLNAHWFMSLADAREKLEDWRRHYNEDRPHSAIGYDVPIAMHYPDGVTSPSS